jgi:hypothetical protein
MFYTRAEQNKRVGYWCTILVYRPRGCLADKSLVLMNGFAIIFLGFVSFGVLHTKVRNFPEDLHIHYYKRPPRPTNSWHGNGKDQQISLDFLSADKPPC